MNLQRVIAFIHAAVECSIYLSPRDPGLTQEEIVEVGNRAGFQAGEIGDALFSAARQAPGTNRFLPNDATIAHWDLFIWNEQPDYRNIVAFDFVVSELKERVRAVGAHNAVVERSVVVERAVATQIPRNDIEVAITILQMTGHIVERDGLLRFAQGREHNPLFSGQRNQALQMRIGQVIPREARARAYPIVKDVIARRIDGRPKHIEPLDAFTDELDRLGYGKFRLWWTQTVDELRHSSPQSTPVSTSVLAAALVEGVLTFIVKHARDQGLAVFRSHTFDDNPRNWKIDHLVASASSGNEAAILDQSARHRAERLITIRQRIHAGRMLSEFPGGPPDLRPDEARDAKDTAELVVRCVLDWLQKHRPS